MQHTITSEGGHTNDGPGSISEGGGTNTKSSPINLSQDYFWNMETSNQAITLGANHWKNQKFAHAVVHPMTGKQMEYMALMEDPDLQPLWKRGFSNEVGRLFQGIRDIPGTNTCFFVELKTYQRTDKSHMAKFYVTTSLA
jgi:hypothetical protein